MTLLKGMEVAQGMSERITNQVEKLKAAGVIPCLAILRIGDQPDQLSYERGATKRCAGLGVDVRNAVLDADVTQEQVMDALDKLNQDSEVHGILLLQPLPSHIDGDMVRNAIAFEKDVDGISDASLGGIFTGVQGAFAPCTAQACIEVCDHYGVELAGKRVTVIGRSLVVGKPVSMLLLQRNATVTVCHSRTADLPSVARQGELLVVAIGRGESIGVDCVSGDQTVIDVGINWNESKGKLVGDVDFDAVEPLVKAITPVPGGVGAVTNCVLVDHVVQAAQRALDR